MSNSVDSISGPLLFLGHTLYMDGMRLPPIKEAKENCFLLASRPHKF